MAKKKESGVLGTVLIVGGIGFAAYMISKSMPKLSEVVGGGDGVSISSPIDLSLAGLGLDGLLPTGLPQRPQDETESGCTPLGVPQSNWLQDVVDRLGLGEKEDVIIEPIPDIIIDPADVDWLPAITNIGGGIINIGDESWDVTPLFPGLNMTNWEYVKRVLGTMFNPFGVVGALSNLMKYGTPFTDIAPLSEMPGEGDTAPVCEGACPVDSGGLDLFFIPQGAGAEAPADSEAATKTTTPTVYAPAVPAIIGAGGEKKELYIL